MYLVYSKARKQRSGHQRVQALADSSHHHSQWHNCLIWISCFLIFARIEILALGRQHFSMRHWPKAVNLLDYSGSWCQWTPGKKWSFHTGRRTDCETPRTQGLWCTVAKRRSNSECSRTSLVFLYPLITENRQVKVGRDEGLGHLVTTQPQKCCLRLRKVSNG